ncbi:MAG: cysteine desulfurase [Firmicutes bacterium]|jgi:cysteine desulfurase|nr:cysteine desulfurase [Bacillota bacterium]
MIYFDNAATTRASEQVAEKVTEMLCHNFGNPASVNKLGLQVEKEIKKTTEILSRGIHCKINEIYYTSGGTEGDNWAIFGTAEGYQRQGKHLITTKIEHPAVKKPMETLEQKGYDITWLSVDKKGKIDLEELKQSIRKDTILVSIILINNETGVIQDVEKIGKIIKQQNENTLFHVDAVQAFGKYAIDVEKMNIDLLTMSAHKINGPKGVGMLYKRQGLKVKPYILGGGQQQGQRSGTENGAGVAGLGVAADICFQNMKKNQQTIFDVKRTLAEGILNGIADVQINGDTLEQSSPYVLNVTFKGLRSEVLLHALESKDIFVSAGSACDSKKKVGSPVLTAMGLPFNEIEGAVRFSFCQYNTVEEAQECVKQLKEIVPFLRKYNR